MSIFRAYDIRGKYPKDISPELAYKIGLAFGKFIGSGKIAVGIDARNSGPELKKELIRGLVGRGLGVVDVGMVPTPLLYFAVAHDKLDGGVMITASHNPKEYQGFKLCGKGGLCLSYETGVGEIERMVKCGVKSGNGKGKVEEKDVVDDYIKFVTEKMKFENPLKIVIDSGNGVAGLVAPEIFRKLGCDVVELYCEPDGNFPNHLADPLVKETLKDLQGKVRETRADLGIAFDGDGDRVGFVDEGGRVFENNRAFALIIENVLEKNPGVKILYDILCSDLIEWVIKNRGGVPVVSRVGHSYIHKKMYEEGCVLGGETSGHYYFRENYKYDDGVFASVKLAELLSRSGKPMSSLGGELPKYFTSDDTRIKCPDDKKFRVVEHLKNKFEKEGYEIDTLDGVKVLFKEGDSWCIVRVSNTQPALVLRWEAKDKGEFERIWSFIKKEVENAIKAI